MNIACLAGSHFLGANLRLLKTEEGGESSLLPCPFPFIPQLDTQVNSPPAHYTSVKPLKLLFAFLTVVTV